MAIVAPLPDPTLQALCDILGATDSGLTGSEIARFLSECGIDDPIPQMTKRHRLFQALRDRQQRDSSANAVLAFTTHCMSPVRHVGQREYFENQRSRINAVLAFAGLSLGEDGQLRATAAARTIGEAEARATTLRKALVERRVHSDVLRFCRAELLADNYFHAVFEATKSVAEKLRLRTGLLSDGSALVDEALGIGKVGHPRLAFNTLTTDSERSEHTGLTNLIKGLFGAFRNTAAHAPKIYWAVSEQDALDILTTISLEFKRRAALAKEPEDMWSVEQYLAQARREIDAKYDYRYSQLPIVFGTLLRQGRIAEHELEGLSEDKLAHIRLIASL